MSFPDFPSSLFLTEIASPEVWSSNFRAEMLRNCFKTQHRRAEIATFKMFFPDRRAEMLRNDFETQHRRAKMIARNSLSERILVKITIIFIRRFHNLPQILAEQALWSNLPPDNTFRCFPCRHSHKMIFTKKSRTTE